MYDFTKFKTIQSFGDVIKNGIITMHMTNDEQNWIANSVREFLSNTKPKKSAVKKRRDMVCCAFEIKIFLMPLQLSTNQ